MPDMTITAEGAVARILREEAFASLSEAAQELDAATDQGALGVEQARAVNEARAAMGRADAIVEQVGYAGDDALELTADAGAIAALANHALDTLQDRLDGSDKSSGTLREAATVAEALEGFVAQATSAQGEPVGA